MTTTETTWTNQAGELVKTTRGRASATDLPAELYMKLRVCRAESSAASPSVKPSRTRRRRRPSSISAAGRCTRAQPGPMASGAHARGQHDQRVVHGRSQPGR